MLGKRQRCCSTRGLTGDAQENVFTGESVTVSGAIVCDTLEATTSVTTQGLIANEISVGSNYTLPLLDGTADQVMQTDGKGVLTFVDPLEGLGRLVYNMTSGRATYPTVDVYAPIDLAGIGSKSIADEDFGVGSMAELYVRGYLDCTYSGAIPAYADFRMILNEGTGTQSVSFASYPYTSTFAKGYFETKIQVTRTGATEIRMARSIVMPDGTDPSIPSASTEYTSTDVATLTYSASDGLTFDMEFKYAPLGLGGGVFVYGVPTMFTIKLFTDGFAGGGGGGGSYLPLVGGTLTGDLVMSASDIKDTVQFLSEDGSATTPVYTFNNDPSTGVYSSGTGELNVGATGTEVLAVNAGGLDMKSNAITNAKTLTLDGDWLLGDGVHMNQTTLRRCRGVYLESTGAANTNTVVLQAPISVATTYNITFPQSVGAPGETLVLNGSAELEWESPVDATKLPLAGGTMTGAIVAPDGSAAAPSMSSTTDVNTGIYFNGSDGVNLSANGVQSGCIDTSRVALGYQAGLTAQAVNSVAIGFSAGQTTQATNSVALGYLAGQNTQQSQAVAIGYNSGKNTQSHAAVAIGSSAGTGTQGQSSVAIGQNAGNNAQESASVAIGLNAGTTTQRGSATAVGSGAGQTNQGGSSVAVGVNAGQTNQGGNSVAVGPNAGVTTQGVNAVAVGESAGKTTQGTYTVAIGDCSGMTSQGENSTALGRNAGNDTQGYNAVAVGMNAGKTTQGINAVAIGREAGETELGEYSISVGFKAGETKQAVNSIIVSSMGAAQNCTQANTIVLNGSTAAITDPGTAALGAGLFIKPVRNAAAAPAAGFKAVYWNSTTGEFYVDTT